MTTTKQAAAAAADLSQTLPVRLRNFFAQYPPQFYSAKVIPKPAPPSPSQSSPSQSQQKVQRDEEEGSAATTPTPATTDPDTDLTASLPPLPSPYTPSRTAKSSTSSAASAASAASGTSYSPSRALLRSLPDHPNPFLPHKNPSTDRWRAPTFSLRRQAELVKLAASHGVEELLPPGKKSREYEVVRRAEVGLRVRGTGIGQKVKGHKWERTMAGRLEERKRAMEKMPAMIRAWKQRGHGRGWKKYPRK